MCIYVRIRIYIHIHVVYRRDFDYLQKYETLRSLVALTRREISLVDEIFFLYLQLSLLDLSFFPIMLYLLSIIYYR